MWLHPLSGLWKAEVRAANEIRCLPCAMIWLSHSLSGLITDRKKA
jgi:hypothetical protein